MSKCYLCGEILTQANESKEHIIPESIGGRLTSNILICKTCNNSTGHLFDSQFAILGNFLASKYNIPRKKQVPIFNAIEVKTGKKLIVEPGFIVSHKDPITDYNDRFIWSKHYDPKRIIEELKRVSKLVGDPPPKIENIIDFTIQNKQNKIDFIFDEAIEPPLFLRSVCKSIVNLYLLKTNDYNNVKGLIQFLGEDIENIFCWFLDLNEAPKHHTGPHHLILIRGERKNKSLYAYYEIFGELGFITMVNSQYQGPDFKLDYTINAMNGEEVEYSYDFNLKSGKILDYLITKPETEILKIIHIH